MLNTSKQEEELLLRKKLNKKYPDIAIYNGRWGIKRYISKSVVPLCDEVHLHHSCGCCDDAPLIARPYIEDTELDVLIYGDPTDNYVGEQDPYFYKDRPDYGWEKYMRDKGYGDKVIEIIQEHFDEQDID